MYLWHKYASAEWLSAREDALHEETGRRLAVVQSPNRKQLRLEVASSSRQMAESLSARFGGAIQRLPRNWRRHFTEAAQTKPLRIGNRLIIRGTRTGQRELRQIVIPAASAFGTGSHATTAMCLRLLEQSSRAWPPGWSMLDAGTGSGILALAARAFGARHVIAIDSDARAIEIAKSNARLNRIDQIEFEIADAINYTTRQKFDVVAANLFSELLIKTTPNWKPRLKADGVLILSGILRNQEREVVRALRNSNLAIQEIRRRGKWIAIVACRQKAG